MSQNDTDTMQSVSINGGLLVQEFDSYIIPIEDLVCVTERKPNAFEIEELYFAWKIVKHVKSNAIVITKDMQTVGIGAGQMNRVGAAKIALEWAREYENKEGLILASDAFFPFDDVVKSAHTYGVSAIIQPGGSIRDQDSIDACNKLGITMVFTRNRHFKH